MKILFIIYDNESYITYFPLGIAYLASILRKEGHQVSIYNQDLHHYTEEHLTKFLDNNYFDVVGIGSVAGYFNYRKILKISEAINKSKNRNKFRYIIGGHMVSAAPEYFLNKTQANTIIVGEGDETIKEALTTDGILEGKIINNLDKLPFPAYDLFPVWYYRLQRLPHIETIDFSMSVISGRGCYARCNFCYRMTPGIRLRSIENIVEEIKLLQKDYSINYIDFADDLTIASKERAIELSNGLRPLGIKWRCEGRLNFADEYILKEMKSAGCVFVNYGIESLDNEVLKNMRKGLTEDIITKGIETTLKVGISPGLNIIWGNLGDTKETLRKSVKFLLKYDDLSQIRTIRFVTPYPGTELYNIALEKGLIKNVEDFYENKHINSDLLTCNFTNISDEEMYQELYKANFELLTNYHKCKIYNTEKQLKNLYFNKDVSFRGWRQT
jgi:radical SAM superfamily enzyme YgiQ (UPF0313 family)